MQVRRISIDIDVPPGINEGRIFDWIVENAPVPVFNCDGCSKLVEPEYELEDYQIEQIGANHA